MTTSNWPLLSALLDCPTLRTLFIHGPPGIGKTFSAYRRGLDGRPLYAITLTEDTPAAELRGHFLPKGAEGFVWHHGPMARAMIEGARLVINEVSHAGPDVHSILFGALESSETARLTLPTGETLIPHPRFQCVLTDNEGPENLPRALLDRIDACICVDTPAPEAIEAFPESLRSIVLGCASVQDDPARRLSLRVWGTLERLLSGGLSFEDAGQAALGINWEGLRESLTIAMGKQVSEAAESVPS